MKEILRKLPKVDKFLEKPEVTKLVDKYGKTSVKRFLNKILDEYRKDIINGKINEINEDEIYKKLVRLLEEYFSQKLKRVINATGITLHTNLGRAPIPFKVFDEIRDIVCRYSNLELSLETGKRSIRYQNVVNYFKDLTEAEDCIIVNNNASAVLLTLSALAKDKEVIISRGELIEIGGSFRIPEVMSQSGAILREVGTTNKTHLKDYESAINENTALFLKVHTSNYRIVGFTESVDLKELVELGKKYNIPVVEDLGSGCFIDLTKFGLPDEPLVQDEIKKGVDIVTFSGDKLLGGPQAGIILGKKELIEKLKKHPLNRAVRIDKFTMSILEGVIKYYFNKEKVFQNVTALKFISQDLKTLKNKAKKIVNSLKEVKEFNFKIEKDYSYTGGGAFPMNKIETIVIIVENNKYSSQEIDEKLRFSEPPLKGRIKDEKFLLDVRTIFDDEISDIKKSFKYAFKI